MAYASRKKECLLMPSSASIIVERKPLGSSTQNTLCAAAAALCAVAQPAVAGMMKGDSRSQLPPPPFLSITDASVQFPDGGEVPPPVPTTADSSLSPDTLTAKFTASLGPVERNQFLFNAPQGALFNFEGGILGGVTPGIGICIEYDITIAFTGGKANYGIQAGVSVPNAGTFSDTRNGQLTQSGNLTGTYEYFFARNGTAPGFYEFELAISWVSARPEDVLTVTVNSVSVQVCVIPSPGAAGVLGFGLMACPGWRRRRR